MLREILDSPIFRAGFAIFVGLPGTLMFLIAFVYGIAFGMSAAKSFSFLAAAFALATLLGTFGIIGIWLRLLKRRARFSSRQLRFTRAALACGITASVMLLFISTWFDPSLQFIAPFIALTAIGVIFYNGT